MTIGVPATYSLYINDVSYISEFELCVDLDQYKKLKESAATIANVTSDTALVDMINLQTLIDGINDDTQGEGANLGNIADLSINYDNLMDLIASTSGQWDTTYTSIPCGEASWGELSGIGNVLYAPTLTNAQHFGLATFNGIIINNSVSTAAQIKFRLKIGDAFISSTPAMAFIPPSMGASTGTYPFFVSTLFGYDSSTSWKAYQWHGVRNEELWADAVYIHERYTQIFRVERHDHDTIDPSHDHIFDGELHTHLWDAPSHFHEEDQDPHEHETNDLTHIPIEEDNVFLMNSYPSTVQIIINGTPASSNPGGSKMTILIPDITSYLVNGKNEITVTSEAPGAVYVYGNYWYYG